MIIVIAITVLALAMVLVSGRIGQHRFRSRVSAEVTMLFSERAASVGSKELAASWDKLPEPVRRYLHYAISTEAPAIRTARLKHDGFFRTKPNQNWLAIKGEEYFTIAKPGFVWNASVRPAPLLWIQARDLMQAGHASMLVKVNSLITIADASGPELDQGASLRWLGEAIWFPYAFVGDRLRWTPIDDHCACATLVQPGLPVDATFEIDDEGKLTSVKSSRYRDLGGGKAVLTPWTARASQYVNFAGFRVPSSVEVSWEIDGKLFSYARFRVTTLDYNVALRF
jgi:hypothetical protein